MGGVSIREAARQVNKSEAALRKAAKAGRITFNADGTVDVEKIRLQLAANTDPVRGGDRRTTSVAPAATHANFGSGWGDPDGAASRSAGTFQAARAAREAYEAKLAELKYREAIGEHLRKVDVELEYSNLFAAVRERLLSVADRVGPLTRSAATDAEAIAIVDREIRLAMQASVNAYAEQQ